MVEMFQAVYRFLFSECPGGQKADALANKFVALSVAATLVFGVPFALGKYDELKNEIEKVAVAAKVQVAGDYQREKNQDDAITSLQQGQHDHSDQIGSLNGRLSRLEGSNDARHSR